MQSSERCHTAGKRKREELPSVAPRQADVAAASRVAPKPAENTGCTESGTCTAQATHSAEGDGRKDLLMNQFLFLIA
jgi:hypothetical protein